MTSEGLMAHTPKFKAGDLVRWKADKVPIGKIKDVLGGGLVYEFDCNDENHPSSVVYEDVTLFDERAEIDAPSDRGEIHDLLGYDE
jgi:hypothetical protein